MKKDQNPVAEFLTCTSLFARQRKAAADKRKRETQMQLTSSSVRSDLSENKAVTESAAMRAVTRKQKG
ncbi:MAG: hypothetical protein JNN17_26030 [Verrucomicrobiaceae bacterium]|nr:hypothetical protein [Verrucomicrobiaceae bacterium]